MEGGTLYLGGWSAKIEEVDWVEGEIRRVFKKGRHLHSYAEVSVWFTDGRIESDISVGSPEVWTYAERLLQGIISQKREPVRGEHTSNPHSETILKGPLRDYSGEQSYDVEAAINALLGTMGEGREKPNPEPEGRAQ